jgi:hypothetical protein
MAMVRTVVVTALAALVLAGCSTPPAAKPTPTPSSTTASPTPAPVPTPSGERGSDWHRTNAGQPWERHVLSVDSVGLLLVVQTDLTPADQELPLSICQAGHAYVQGIGAPNATVTVVAGKVRLAESQRGGTCRLVL